MNALLKTKTTIRPARASAMASRKGATERRLPAARLANERSSPGAAAATPPPALVTPAEQWEALVSAMCDVRDKCVCSVCAVCVRGCISAQRLQRRRPLEHPPPPTHTRTRTPTK